MRIASLQPSVSATLAALGRLDTLCAHTRYCIESVPALAAAGLPVLADSWSFDKPGELDALLATRPDIVIASVPYRLESLATILKSGVPVLALAPKTLADIYNDIRLIASTAAAVPEGEALVHRMQQAIDETRAANGHTSDRPIVYCEEWGKPLIHSQPWIAELIEAAGGSFLGHPGATATAETIAHHDPDVLLFAWCGAGNRVPLDRVIEQRSWQSLRAVRTRRVHCIPDHFLNTPAPTLLDGLACIAAALHPGRLPNAESSSAVAAMLTLTTQPKEQNT